MVWENKVEMITMLCPIKSTTKEESIPYWQKEYQSEHHSVIVDHIESE